MRRTPEERFLAKIEKASDGCWRWTAAKYPNGYGMFSIAAGQATGAHRWAYQHYVGPIPAGLEIDHLCGHRACVNPAHLEAVTHRENLLRGDTIAAASAARTHCVKGHPLSGDNLYVDPLGKRRCRICRRDAWHRHHRMKKAAA